MPATKRGVYHDLSESEYFTSIDGVKYFFSSKFLQQKFIDKLRANRADCDLVYRKMELHYNLNDYSDLLLYKDVERRGFRVYMKGREWTWQEISARVLQSAIQRGYKN